MNASGKTETKILSFSHDYGTFKSIKLAALTLSAYEGYNLYRRMEKFKRAHLRFLYDHTIPTTNNTAERYLRNYKRKQKQAMSFRSFTSIEDLCDGKSVLIKIRKNDGANVFQEVTQRFDS